MIFSGVWQQEIRRDGEPLVPKDDWEEVSWISDEDIDYLELQMGLSGGATLQRSMLLARKDRLLLLADAVLDDRPGTIEYRGTLPLCLGMTLKTDGRSREGLLVGSKRRAKVLPLALPEWRAEKRVGELVQPATDWSCGRRSRADACSRRCCSTSTDGVTTTNSPGGS